jgi:DNA-binding response OmpR family regulator
MPEKEVILLKPEVQGIWSNEEIYDDGYLRVEHKNYYLSCGDRPVKTSRIEFLIVSLLAQNINRCVSAETIWEKLWNKDKPFNRESLKVHVCHIRTKLAAFGIQLDTKNNDGYRLAAPPRRAS